MRLLHLIVIAVLVSAAVHVYKIKFDSTLQAERVAKLKTDVQRVREATAALRAQWAQLDNPTRIQGLAERHFKLKPVDAAQFDSLDRLPERPASPVPPDTQDPIGAMISLGAPELPTGSIKTPPAAR
jgi:cell division protein FtsL